MQALRGSILPAKYKRTGQIWWKKSNTFFVVGALLMGRLLLKILKDSMTKQVFIFP